jgi:iron complex transport system substrate-binding protein
MRSRIDSNVGVVCMKKMFFQVFFTAVFIGLYIHKIPAADIDSAPCKQYCRIISLAPSITETLFELGLGGNVVGVTRYCNYPPEARNKERVGGYYDPSYEEIVRLKPDLVVMLREHAVPRSCLQNLRINILTVDHSTVRGIVNSVAVIGCRCGAGQKAERLVTAINERINRIKNKTGKLHRPRVMVSLGRGMGSTSLDDIYIAGRNTFYDELVVLAGGVNAYNGKAIAFPQVSRESIYQLDPEIIIDMIPDLAGNKQGREKILAEWNGVVTVDAVRNKRVFLFEEDYSVLPGPRFILLLEKMSRVIHPEVEWN